jgi:polyisoprenyl-phosphate glycosyltransferase
MWNHYAASIVKAHIPLSLVPIDRARRIAGHSKMNFVSLVAHGLSAMAVFAEIVGVRLLVSTCVLIGLALAGLGAAVLVYLGMGQAVPAWVAWSAIGLGFVFIQGFALAFVFVFIALHGRSGVSFLPIRDYRYFVQDVRQVTFGN